MIGPNGIPQLMQAPSGCDVCCGNFDWNEPGKEKLVEQVSKKFSTWLDLNMRTLELTEHQLVIMYGMPLLDKLGHVFVAGYEAGRKANGVCKCHLHGVCQAYETASREHPEYFRSFAFANGRWSYSLKMIYFLGYFAP